MDLTQDQKHKVVSELESVWMKMEQSLFEKYPLMRKKKRYEISDLCRKFTNEFFDEVKDTITNK